MWLFCCLFFLTGRNFLKKVRLKVVKLYELINRELRMTFWHLKESKLVNLIKPLLNDAKKVLACANERVMNPNTCTVPPLVIRFLSFPTTLSVALDMAAFMIGMIALQSIGASLCTLIFRGARLQMIQN